jgi:hypothetical protein
MKKIECDWCEGAGVITGVTCCGDDYMVMEDLCPTCKEHQGELNDMDCDNCGGSGTIDYPETKEDEEFLEEKRLKQQTAFRKRFKKLTGIDLSEND